MTHVKQTLPHGLWFSRKLLLNELLNIYLPGWGDGRGVNGKTHTHILRIALFVLLFYTQSLLKKRFGIQKSTLVAELTLITEFFLELEHRRN